MILWIALAALIALTIVALVRPLIVAEPKVDSGDDAEVYAHQLEEVEADRARGLISEADAESARTEIARRLLRAHRAGRGGARMRRRDWVTAGILAVFIPVFSLGAYLSIGAPDYGDQPLAARQGPADRDELERLLARAEERLADSPDDARGWLAVAPIYQRLGRFEDAAEAWGRANAILGDDPDRLVARAESLVMAAGGEITDEARAAFARAAELDPQNVTPAVFLAVAARQRGNYEEATERWRTILAQSEGDEQWLQIAATEFRLMGEDAELPADLSLPQAGAAPGATAGPAPGAGSSPGPTAEQRQAAADMDPEARQRMIEGMVDGLATRLEREGGTAEEWLRLVRSYTVLGDEDQARGTLRKALEALPESEHAVLTQSPDVRQLMDGQ